MKVSKKCVDLVKSFEGLRLDAYKDSVGVVTIGYGTTNADKGIIGKTITMGMHISKETAENWLEKSLNAKYAPSVNKYDSKYNWTQNEFDALVSFAYNIGSIDSLTANGTRSKEVIAQKILAYDKAGGKTLAGLTRRRKAEHDLFVKKGNEAKEQKQGLSYYKKCDSKYISISKALESIGVDGSLAKRKKIAKANNIKGYIGTEEQNVKMLRLLKLGKLVKA